VDPARTERDLRCEIAYTRTLLAVAARDNSDPGGELLRRLAELGALADARASSYRDTPMARLASRLQLVPAQIDLVWAIVAASVDPRLGIPLEALWGSAARRGLTVAAYTHVRGVEAEVGRDLGAWLGSRNRLVTGGLVVAVDAQAPPAWRTYVASERLLGYLVGDDEPGAGLRRVEPEMLILDAAQRVALAELASIAHADAVIVVEGPRGCGRTAAIASAIGRSLVVLDGAKSAVAAPQVLVGLMREVVLGAGQPVIANIDQLPTFPARCS